MNINEEKLTIQNALKNAMKSLIGKQFTEYTIARTLCRTMNNMSLEGKSFNLDVVVNFSLNKRHVKLIDRNTGKSIPLSGLFDKNASIAP